jgi:hypothetical protein
MAIPPETPGHLATAREFLTAARTSLDDELFSAAASAAVRTSRRPSTG